MKKFLFASLFVFFLSLTAQAVNLYILYDPACMDRLEYTYLNNQNSAPYLVYQVTTIPGEKIILDVGTESDVTQNFPPAQFIRCNNAVFDEKFVNDINSNIDRVFIVVKTGENSYLASPVTFAARYVRAEDYILYDSPKYRFQFDLKMGTIGENIAFRNPKAQVFFEGRIDNDCSGAYLFRQNAEYAGNPYTGLVLVPEIGITEERSGINIDDAMKNTLRLAKVNGKSLNSYLAKICKGVDVPDIPTQSALTSSPGSNEFITVGANPAPSDKISLLTARSGESQISPAAAPQFHTVAKGETLFRISKKYGVSVDQLQAWNNKGKSTVILKGEKLQVSAPTSTLTAKEGVVNVLPKSFENGSGVSNVQPVNSLIPATGTASDRHTVAPGETVASIAMRYGYTEARFREFNKLGKYDVPKIGQVLKTSDCDCPDTPATLYNQTTSNYNYTQALNPGLTAKSPELTTVPTEMGYTPTSGGQAESFSNDAFGQPSTDQKYLNTPYFIDRLITPASNTEPAQSYSNTGGRIYDTGSTGNQLQTSSYTSSPAPLNLPLGYSENALTPSNNTTAKSGDRSFYIVKEGDTLFRIARMYGVTVEYLRSVNNLGSAEVIIPYQKVYLN